MQALRWRSWPLTVQGADDFVGRPACSLFFFPGAGERRCGGSGGCSRGRRGARPSHSRSPLANGLQEGEEQEAGSELAEAPHPLCCRRAVAGLACRCARDQPC
ncbi:hypothetical protein MRX96_028346 [Rhipicephalus microplus]